MNQCYYNGDFYQAAVATVPGENPDTQPTAWVKIAIPGKWRWVLAQLTYAGLLALDGQTDKANVARSIAYGRDAVGLDELVRAEANEESRREIRGGTARVNTGRTRPVAASVILDDAYRLIGWDTDQLDTREKGDARMALSQALQEVWERWWWQELMICARATFAETLGYSSIATVTGDFEAGYTCYWEATDKYYYVAYDNPAVNPTDANGEVQSLWVELEFDREEYARWDPTVTYERGVNDRVRWDGSDWALRGSPTSLAEAPDENDANWWRLPSTYPTLPYTQFDGTVAGPFGPIRSVSANDPRGNANPELYELDVTPDGTRVVALTEGKPWVWSRRVTPVLTGDDYDATASYEATDPQDLVYDADPDATATTITSTTPDVYFITGNPNGVQSAVRPAIAYSATGSVWFKTGTGTNSSGWELAIGDGT